MAEDSPVQSILNLRDKIANFGRKPATPKVDNSWHDSMVKQASDSFRKSAQKKVSAPADAKPAPKKKTAPGKKKITKR